MNCAGSILRGTGARCVRSGIFFHGSIYFAEAVPTKYHTPLCGFAKCVLLRTDPGRDPDRENGHYENIYIDMISM